MKLLDLVDNVERAKKKPRETLLMYPWDNRYAYANYLAQTYHYVSQTEPLIKLAASKARHPWLQEMFLHHAKEEHGHEMLAANDLKKMGYKISNFPELKSTRRLHGYNAENIAKSGFHCLLGYALLLEGLSVELCGKLAEKVEAAHGKGCASFFRVHPAVDVEHSDEAMDLLKRLTEEDYDLINGFLLPNSELYCGMFANLIEVVIGSRRGAA